jgi:hypothetical protein
VTRLQQKRKKDERGHFFAVGRSAKKSVRAVHRKKERKIVCHLF